MMGWDDSCERGECLKNGGVPFEFEMNCEVFVRLKVTIEMVNEGKKGQMANFH